MKAAIYTAYGPPEVVTLQKVDKPQPTDRELLIKVHATTVNRTDCGFRSAEYFISRFFSGLFKPKHKILGNEFAGTVEAVGKAVTSFALGDKVFGYNDARFGGHAEYMVVGEHEAVATIPAGFSFEQAAALTEGSHYALCDIRAAKIKRGQKALVNGATGAIGSAAVQILKYFGAEVTAVCGTNHIELVRSLGAERVIDYTLEDFTQVSGSAIPGGSLKTGETFDFIFDAVGKSSFGKCKPLLAPKGVYVSTELGRGSQNIWLALITPLLGGKRVLFPLPLIKKEDVLFLKKLAEEGKFRPVIDRHYPLEEIVEAYRYVETGQKIGNVIISVERSSLV